MSKSKSPVIENRKARHEYFVEDTIECSISLRGNEVKSIRDGKMSIKESWIDVRTGEMFLKQAHITPWEKANRFDIDEKRDIKLLAHRGEINKLYNKVRLDGYTLVPLKVYFNDRNKCKILVGLCKGKKNYDKRADDKNRTMEREMLRYK